MMVEWLPDPDTQGGQVSSGGAGRLPVGGAQHQQAGLLLVSPVSRDSIGISKLTLSCIRSSLEIPLHSLPVSHGWCPIILGYYSIGSGPSLTLVL